MRRTSLAAKAVAVIVATVGTSVPVSANEGESFYAGKTLTYIVATKPGGGYDTYARLIAAHLPKHLPGVRVRIQNIPGAGDIIGTNKLARSRPDGLTIGTFNSGLLYGQLSDAPGIQFDLRDFEWIGKASSDSRMLIAAGESGIRSVSQLRAAEKPVLFGANGVGSASYAESFLLARLLGIDIRIVTGMASADRQMSMIRGELIASFGSASSFRRFVENGYGVLLLQVGGEAGDNPEMNSLLDSEEDRAVYDLILATTNLGRMTAAPPGTPDSRLRVLRGAYTAVLEDEEFRSEAARRQLPVDYGDAAYVEREVNAALNQSPAVVAIIREATGR